MMMTGASTQNAQLTIDLFQICVPHVKPPWQPLNHSHLLSSNIWNAWPNSSVVLSNSSAAFRRAVSKHHLFLLAYPDSSAKSGKIKPSSMYLHFVTYRYFGKQDLASMLYCYGSIINIGLPYVRVLRRTCPSSLSPCPGVKNGWLSRNSGFCPGFPTIRHSTILPFILLFRVN